MSHEAVRNVVDMAHLVGTTTEIQEVRPGRYEVECPFCGALPPSMGVDAQATAYYCFNCRKTGDCFTWVQEVHGLNFEGAVTYLRERYGSLAKR